QPVYVLEEAPPAGGWGLRPSTLSDLDLLVPACAAAHREEIGIDPMRRDPDGFRWRTRMQVEDGRSWLWLEDGVIRFKAEASAWTPNAVQLQQVWVDPQARGRGYAQRGMRDLCRLLLERGPAVCLFVRPEHDGATGHTASDQVETILYRLASRGSATGIAPSRPDGVVHPLLDVWRRQTKAYCEAQGLAFRVDSSNADTKRGLIRDEILPLLRRLHPAADANILRALDLRETLPPALAELLSSPAGSKRVDLGGGVQAVREYDRLWLERGPVDLVGEIRWGEWRIRSGLEGLKVRGWR